MDSINWVRIAHRRQPIRANSYRHLAGRRPGGCRRAARRIVGPARRSRCSLATALRVADQAEPQLVDRPGVARGRRPADTRAYKRRDHRLVETWAGVVRGSRAAPGVALRPGLLERGVATAEPLLLCSRAACSDAAGATWPRVGSKARRTCTCICGIWPAGRRQSTAIGASIGRERGQALGQHACPRGDQPRPQGPEPGGGRKSRKPGGVPGGRRWRAVLPASERPLASHRPGPVGDESRHAPLGSRVRPVRFLRSYLAASPLSAPDWKPSRTAARRHSGRIKRRMARQGKALA